MNDELIFFNEPQIASFFTLTTNDQTNDKISTDFQTVNQITTPLFITYVKYFTLLYF